MSRTGIAAGLARTGGAMVFQVDYQTLRTMRVRTVREGLVCGQPCGTGPPRQISHMHCHIFPSSIAE